MNAPIPHQDAEVVRRFFNQWELYGKLVTFNYLHHEEAYAAIASALARRLEPFSFLDLGAGDAAWTARVLEGRPLTDYEAVDLSPVALELARKNTKGLNCPVRFTEQDFTSFIESNPTPRDVVFIGLSLHHLPKPDKEAFFPKLRRSVVPGGSLIFFEPARLETESREEMLERWWPKIEDEWIALSPAELDLAREHIVNHDHPESVETYAALAREGGFSDVRVWYHDPGEFCAVIECHADSASSAA